MSSWISERNNFNKSESPCFPNGSHHIFSSIQYIILKTPFEEFQNGCNDGHLGYPNRTFINSKPPCCPDVSLLVWAQSNIWLGRICRLTKIKMAVTVVILEQNDLAHLHQVSVQSDIWFQRRWHLKILKIAIMSAILDSRTEPFWIYWYYVALMPPTKFQLNPTEPGDVDKNEKANERDGQEVIP